ncbi:hypothetical protein I3760_12G015000 [Carya illinoinensis]|nr:hypothetical protein I3760_12G015000 [Carya illinoinensis]
MFFSGPLLHDHLPNIFFSSSYNTSPRHLKMANCKASNTTIVVFLIALFLVLAKDVSPREISAKYCTNNVVAPREILGVLHHMSVEFSFLIST